MASGDEMKTQTDDEPNAGGEPDMYRWTQTFEECELSLNVDAQLRAKDLCIEFSPQLLRVAVKGQGKLEARIHVAQSTWPPHQEFAKKSKMLTIVLSKVKARPW